MEVVLKLAVDLALVVVAVAVNISVYCKEFI